MSIKNQMNPSMSDSKYISIKGAKVNNLKNIDVDIPRNKLVVGRGDPALPGQCPQLRRAGKYKKRGESRCWI